MNEIIVNELMKTYPNLVFVFGSNLAGRHGKGAAKTAVGWGAIYGQGEGFAGRTYAIPTKDANLRVRTLQEIQMSVNTFIDFARSQPERLFLVTPIGCGLAGYSPKDIAPMFKTVPGDPYNPIGIRNVFLPQVFLSETGWFQHVEYIDIVMRLL